ncbi:geraniol 8-hydroxylase-like isoform X2 [Solanum tuberosum]|uniref:geraniol 8-hydroxylase-like isoform X2 n=1 Tax=Solanum tuberosum TaxID=4113 RepID=UPI00073A3574|nr:PREDICTED: geraniol 8-hydroxylase-like isoform X2 [Solanum tuberosum]
MDNYTLVLGSIFALSFFYIIIAKICNRGNKKFPPGPSPWPIIGNFHLLGTKHHRSLVNLAQIYGPIMSLKIGQKTLVVISSSTMAKQVLQKQDLAFSTRFITNALQAHNHCKFSVACLPVCPQWRTLRKILNTSIFSSNRLDVNEHLRSQKVKELIAYCAKCSQQGKALDICQVVFKTNFNLMCNTLFSKDLADPFSDSKDLFAGGTDSPTTTIEWAMAEILRKPEIMKKVRVELAKVVGKGKPVEESNIPKLPYLQFIVKETLRLHPPTPFLIPRKVEQDVKLCNYIIPKGSLVLVNVWAIGRDPTFWKDPLVFKPERFQTLEVDMQGQDFALIPFGAGRRICPGLPLTLRLVPIMLGSLLNSFNWKLEANIEPKDLDMEETFSFISSKAHPLRVIPSPL